MTTDRLADGPVLILVNGPPDAAKAGLARVLADRLGVPRFSRDEIRAGLFDATSPLTRTSEAVMRKLSALASEMLIAQATAALEGGASVLVEGPFQPRVDEMRVARLQREFGVRPLQLLVTAALPVLVRRHEEHAVRRLGRQPRSPQALRDLERSLRDDTRPLDGLGAIRIDTTSFEEVDIDALEARIRQWMLSGLSGLEVGAVRRD
jgi:predicted kinase